LNSLTHLLGLALAVVGSIFLVLRALQPVSALRVVAYGIFGLSMIALYLASTLFHSLAGPLKDLWAKADHCAIYLLIAGTYTPFALITLAGPRGWGLLAVVWSLAVWGIIKELRSGRDAVPALALYLAMGWSGVAVGLPLVQGLHGPGWQWLLGGCLCYSVGVVFYVLGDRVPHGHGIWHLFVLAGTTSHYVTILRFLA
jgi:hemolysin III